MVASKRFVEAWCSFRLCDNFFSLSVATAAIVAGNTICFGNSVCKNGRLCVLLGIQTDSFSYALFICCRRWWCCVLIAVHSTPIPMCQLLDVPIEFPNKWFTIGYKHNTILFSWTEDEKAQIIWNCFYFTRAFCNWLGIYIYTNTIAGYPLRYKSHIDSNNIHIHMQSVGIVYTCMLCERVCERERERALPI